MAQHLSRPKADLVHAAPDRKGYRRIFARKRPPRIRRLALERLLGAAGCRDRVQARALDCLLLLARNHGKRGSRKFAESSWLRDVKGYYNVEEAEKPWVEQQDG
jgi:hypothetical protein